MAGSLLPCIFDKMIAIKKYLIIAICILFYFQYGEAQMLPDSVRKKRIQLITGINAAGYATSVYLLNSAWYKNYPKGAFRVFRDGKEWNQMDKIGHAWTTYMLGAPSASMWAWTGMNETASTLLGGLTGLTFLTAVELLDAHSAKWGWSWGDMAANTGGAALFIGQQLGWKEQRIQMKFSFHQYQYKDPLLLKRANELYGSSWYERMLKDYNAQTYWLSVNVKSFAPRSNWPAWLNIAAGYGADGLYGGFENIAKDENGVILFDRRDIPRSRQFYLSPDIDLTRIPTKKKWLKTTLTVLNIFKTPAPAIEWSNNGKLRIRPIYF